jgi:hypothetical protein
VTTARYTIWVEVPEHEDGDYSWMDKVADSLKAVPGFIEHDFEDTY